MPGLLRLATCVWGRHRQPLLMVSKRKSPSNCRDRYVVRLLRQFFAASLLSCRKSGNHHRSIVAHHPTRKGVFVRK